MLRRCQAYIHRVTCVDQQTKKLVHDARENGTLFLSQNRCRSTSVWTEGADVELCEVTDQSVPRSKHTPSRLQKPVS